MGTFLVSRPQDNFNRRVLCGHTVLNKLGKFGGFYVKDEKEAIRVCENANKWLGRAKLDKPKQWRYEAVPEGQEVEVPATGADLPDAPEPSGIDHYHYLQREVDKILAAGGPPIQKNSKRARLDQYIERHSGYLVPEVATTPSEQP